MSQCLHARVEVHYHIRCGKKGFYICPKQIMICFVQLKKALLGHCRYVCVHILTSGSCLTGPVVAPWPMSGPPLLKSPEEGTRPLSITASPQPLVIVCGPPYTHLSLQPAQVFLTCSHRHQILPSALLQPTASLCHCAGQTRSPSLTHITSNCTPHHNYSTHTTSTHTRMYPTLYHTN